MTRDCRAVRISPGALAGSAKLTRVQLLRRMAGLPA